MEKNALYLSVNSSMYPELGVVNTVVLGTA